MADFDPAISTGLGLEVWVNHLAFAASDLDDIEDRKQRWLDSGYDVVEIDHGWCTSIYTNDPNGILVEWCTDTKPYTAEDREHALPSAGDGRTRARGTADALVPQGDHEGRRACLTSRSSDGASGSACLTSASTG